MAGNIINIQGNYIDVHGIEVVNFNIDKGLVTMDTNPSVTDAKEKAALLLQNAEFMLVMHKAVELGLCKQEGWHYKWEKKMDAVYFASEASHKYHLTNYHDQNGDIKICWQPFEALFDEKDFRSKFNDYLQGKIRKFHKEEIDTLLK